MKKSLIAIILFFLAFAVPAVSSPLSTAEKWAICVGEADIPCLEKLLSPHYRHTHGTGLVETKEQFIGALESGSRQYEPIYFENLEVEITNDTAVVLGKFNLKVLSNGNTLQAVNRFGMVIINSPTGEQVFYFQATPLK